MATEKGERRRAALVEAAAELLRTGGYEAVRHRAVAEKAGLPLAEVHRRVPGYPATQVDRFLDRLRPRSLGRKRALALREFALGAEALERFARGEPLHRVLAEISADVLGVAVEYSSEALAEILSPQHFVRVRTTPGGPAPSETARAHDVSRKRLTADTAWLEDTIAALRAADRELTAAAARL